MLSVHSVVLKLKKDNQITLESTTVRNSFDAKGRIFSLQQADVLDLESILSS